MPEYLWSRMLFNILGFLICPNKNKYGWINLEHARIYLKYNVKDTLNIASLRERERGTFRTASNVQGGAFVKNFNMALWIHLGVWICAVIRIGQGSQYARDTQGSGYAWVCSWLMLGYVWICLKQNLKQLHKLSSIYRYKGAFRILPNM